MVVQILIKIISFQNVMYTYDLPIQNTTRYSPAPPPPRITCDFLVLYACSNKGVPLRTPKPPPPEQSHNWSTQLLPLNVVIGTPRHSRLLRLRHVFITFCVIKFRSRTFGFLLQLNMHGNSSVARSLRLFSHAL